MSFLPRPPACKTFKQEEVAMITDTVAKEVMTKKLVTIPLGSRLAEALEIMDEKRIRHLPVVDASGKIVGILSQKDFAHLENIPFRVEHFMKSPVEFVSEETPLRSAIFHMLEKKISALLMADERGCAVGVVTTDDLLWYLAQLLEKESNKHPLSSIFSIRTLGEIANQLNLVGI